MIQRKRENGKQEFRKSRNSDFKKNDGKLFTVIHFVENCRKFIYDMSYIPTQIPKQNKNSCSPTRCVNTEQGLRSRQILHNRANAHYNYLRAIIHISYVYVYACF
ncbi:hypothetical protein A9490_00160 [Bacillus thuringiensis]|nr:hypothetical protein A9490_00160 [Bacillus thuringiensis]